MSSRANSKAVLVSFGFSATSCRKSIIIAAIALLFTLYCIPKQAVSETANKGPELRRKLFIMERNLSRKKVDTPKTLGERVLTKTPAELPEAPATTAAKDSKGAETATSTAGGDGKNEPGSVSFGFEGGKLDSFSMSSTGLDLSEMTDFGLKVMLRSDSVDLDSLDKDGSMSDSFASSNRESYYGLQNFEEYKDLFAKDDKTKDYTMLGMGLSFETGGMKIGMLNYSKPPAKKKAAFFGSGTTGPYKMNATNVIPGSETVRVDGTKLDRGTGYTISYSKGEVSFAEEVASGSRVVVEYEVADSSGEPGRFTGFRIQSAGGGVEKPAVAGGGKPGASAAAMAKADAAPQGAGESAVGDDDKKDDGSFKFGPLEFKKWGASYLSDDVISYTSSGDEIKRVESAHQLFGFDGAVSLWKSTEIEIEAAQSTGNKQRELGSYARASFTIADSQASDLNPLGPYQLDDTKLPIIEDSEELRLNGELLTRDTDYTLDNEYGTLRLKKKDLNLSSLDSFEITYRYMTEEDQLSGDTGAQKDIAGGVSIKNTFGDLSHSYSFERRGADFMQVGGKTNNQLKNEKQEVAWKTDKGLSLKLGRNSADTLQDRNSGLKKTQQGTDYSANYTKGDLSFGITKSQQDQFDNKVIKDTDTTKSDRAINLSYAFSKKYKFSYNDKQSNGSDTRSGEVAETRSLDRGLKIEAEPMKKVNVSLGFGAGETGNTSSGVDRVSTKRSRNGSMKYRASKKLQFSYDMSENEYSNEVVALTEDTVDDAATDTTSTGNSDSKWTMQYRPDKDTSLMLRVTDSRQDQTNGTTDKTQNVMDLRRKLGENTDVQLQYSAIDSDRPTQTQSTDVKSVSVKTKKKWFDGMEITLKHEEQNSRIDRIVESATRTETGSSADQVTVKCSPFWKKRNVTVEYQLKNGDQATDDTEPTNDREARLKMEIEIPFVKESYIALKREMTGVTGSRETNQNITEISLNGNPIKGMTAQLSYKSEIFNDELTPSSSRSESSLNLVLKGTIEW